jgi:rhodanese-related sulfurtransferase
MGLGKWIQRRLGGVLGKGESRPVRPPIMAEEPEPEAPELSAAELQLLLQSETPPLILDVREPYEWRQVHLADAVHIPMDQVPDRLRELPQAQEIVVLCAHGSRSYGVAAFLLERGYRASNLAGGISRWAAAGGAVVQPGIGQEKRSSQS